MLWPQTNALSWMAEHDMTVTPGKMKKPVKSQQPNNPTTLFREEQEEQKQNDLQQASGVRVSKLSETDIHLRPDVLQNDLCSQPSTVQLDWHSPETMGTDRSTTGTLFSPQMRAGSRWACDRRGRVWRRRGECYHIRQIFCSFLQSYDYNPPGFNDFGFHWPLFMSLFLWTNCKIIYHFQK